MQVNATSSDEVILDRIGSAAVIRLNRPKALNSLNLPMVRAIRQAMERFAGDPAISCVILKGDGDRGLCAGGDIRVIHDMGKAGDPEVTRFWHEEFPLNYLISHYAKPYVALMDGITMGGGVGLSSHGAHRIVTERTRLAMPETGIGYFPDVGATWLLPQAPGETGTWLALTGEVIGAADAIYANLADVCIPSERLADLVKTLGELKGEASDDEARSVIDRFAVVAGPGELEAHRALIDRAFRFDTVEEIVRALEKEDGEFAARSLDLISKRSPTSLKLALRLIRLGRQSSGLVECLEREFAAGLEVLRNHDFYEGVRAAIIDKDRNPKWSPATLAGVGDAEIERYVVTTPGALFPDHRL